IIGLIIGGFISNQWLYSSDTIALNPQTVQDLEEIGIANAGSTFLPIEIYSINAMLTLKGFLILISAGILVGFGARYAGGCTSGHGIVGLSKFSKESFIAVGGFFIGGLIMTWLILPHLF
ncbi:MAG: YeeE/YedE family protein, partial [Flavobacteriaceae bacterium]|nr:YeeE/YedE family protein [Flavobacteriaceae bacterium]